MADVMIVDDDSDTVELIAEFLRLSGHEVRVASNGAEGLELVRSRTPDVILLDVDMPVLSGPAMASAMFDDGPPAGGVPVILASAALDLRSIAANVGTPYFLEKPYGLESLAKLIQTVLMEGRPPVPVRKRSPAS